MSIFTCVQESARATISEDAREVRLLLVRHGETAWNREKRVQVILAEQMAAQEQIKQQMEADIEAYKAAKVAEGEQLAAVKIAEAIRTKAEAQKDAATLQAEGDQAREMVPVNVQRERVAVEARQVQDVEAARVDVLRNELSAKAEYEQISVELEKALAQINANKEVGVAFANSFGDAFSHAKVNLYGDPSMLGNAMSSFSRAAGIGAFIDGMKGEAAGSYPRGTRRGKGHRGQVRS